MDNCGHYSNFLRLDLVLRLKALRLLKERLRLGELREALLKMYLGSRRSGVYTHKRQSAPESTAGDRLVGPSVEVPCHLLQLLRRRHVIVVCQFQVSFYQPRPMRGGIPESFYCGEQLYKRFGCTCIEHFDHEPF